MLSRSQEQVIGRTAESLTVGELPLHGTDLDRHARMRKRLLRVSPRENVQTEWGDILPDPEVSLVFLERLSELSPIMARLSLRLTVDDFQGCWAFPLYAEYDSKARARYATIYDAEQKKQGVLAHRYVWRTLIDPGIPSQTYLDHICRVHACCNVTHLQAVDSGTNTKRGHHARHILGGQDPLFHPE